MREPLLSLAALVACVAPVGAAQSSAVAEPNGAEPGAVGGPGLALTATKALTCAWEGPQVVNDAVVLVRDGKIEAVGAARELAVPEGYAVRDFGESWLMPGMIDLHCHVAGMSLFQINDLNETVLLANPGVRASASVVPNKDTLQLGLAGGVTSVLYIPGSGSNIGGQGVLLKTGFDRFEEMLIRNPGSMKLAQAGNPERWGFQPGRSLQNWNTRNTIRRGIANARARAELAGDASAGLRDVDPQWRRYSDPQWDVFHHLIAGTTQISAHTQVYQVVLNTIVIVRQELGLPVYIDHGTIGGWKAGALAHQAGVPAIVGPRAVDTTSAGFQRVTAATRPGIRGVAAGYQEQGHDMVGFNTDSPIVPEEELSVQAAVGVRYGFRDDALQAVRGLTIVPARAAGIADRVGSLEPGKDADVLVVTGHPADPRSAVLRAWIEGRLVYTAEEDRLW